MRLKSSQISCMQIAQKNEWGKSQRRSFLSFWTSYNSSQKKRLTENVFCICPVLSKSRRKNKRRRAGRRNQNIQNLADVWRLRPLCLRVMCEVRVCVTYVYVCCVSCDSCMLTCGCVCIDSEFKGFRLAADLYWRVMRINNLLTRNR